MTPPAPDSSTGIPCEGWWEQAGYGRQPMKPLWLRFEAGRIVGSGVDMIGPFSLTGTLGDGGQVAILKQYHGRHSVDYLGAYDGEGLLFGEWRIGPWTGTWAIRILRPDAADCDEAIEIAAPAS